MVRLEVEISEQLHRFVPERVTARVGDVLRFRVVSGAPHSIAFEPAGISPNAHAALNAAMPDRSGDLSGPVLPANGAEYRIVVPPLPPGRYVFYSVPHRAYDMRGELVVAK
ncbi:MAG TPA: plastocyanin/azurin family copper-binding protein [Gemmatimonadales bacterium]|nr:plastocyanin/azurin family copper-binding protein [Gemmatimonadales bacterium]